MKLIKFIAVSFFALVLFAALPAKAAPFKAADKNPNVVAFFPTGAHGVPDEPGILHEGKDLVMRAGNSGNFQQWFYGTSAEAPGFEGDHTVWREFNGGNIPNNWTLIPDPNPEWGTYFQPGVDYLVKTNDFHVTGGNHGI